MTYHGTTILAVIRDGKLAFGGDGQVTLGDQIVKARAQKIRRLGSHPIIGGFAGATADAFTLFERFENKLDSMPGNMTRAAVELARDWRMDKALRQLQAMLLSATAKKFSFFRVRATFLSPTNRLRQLALEALRLLQPPKPCCATQTSLRPKSSRTP